MTSLSKMSLWYLAAMVLTLASCNMSFADWADTQPGGKYDYGYAPYSRGNDYDNSGRGAEERDRDRVESNRQSYIDSERRRTESDRQAESYRRESLRQYQEAEAARSRR